MKGGSHFGLQGSLAAVVAVIVAGCIGYAEESSLQGASSTMQQMLDLDLPSDRARVRMLLDAQGIHLLLALPSSTVVALRVLQPRPHSHHPDSIVQTDLLWPPSAQKTGSCNG